LGTWSDWVGVMCGAICNGISAVDDSKLRLRF